MAVTNLRLCMLCAACVMTTSCNLEDGALKDAKQRIAAQLRDPSSAEFRGLELRRYVFEAQPGTAVCGEVNAKNGFGGYAGFSRFYATHDEAVIDPGNSAALFEVWHTFYCVQSAS